MCSYASFSRDWMDREGRSLHVAVESETQQDAIITLSGVINGRIELSIAPSLWLRVDVYLGGAWFGRGWIERGYEECEIWPDGSDGIIGPRVEDDPPGRISKRGSWIQFDTSQWPGHERPERWVGFEITGA
ncbi:hypothetical protein [Hyphomonas sp.]|uniref:hypothetical protein n=1 Tax=Hyphomonas sp. TaxID=87 RepID=UPI00391AF387